MKKIVFLFISVLALVSCSNHEVEYNQGEFMTNKYNAAFVKTFGQPAENQDWGFATRVLPASFGAVTRTANTNGNQWTDYGYTVPGAITAAEREAVLEVFNKKGEASYTSLVDWEDFFVQQVYKGVAKHKSHAVNNAPVVGSEHMDWLCTVTNKHANIQSWPYKVTYTIGDEFDDHINNFNNGNCKDYNGIMLMVGSNTNKFGFKSSEDNGHVFYNFRMEYIAPYGYFVGFDFEANGINDNEKIDRDYIYNDWIVKIVPGKGTTPTPPTPPDRYTVRIICEDLYASEGSDFDFNDVVFDASYTEGSNKTTVTIQCAGGTLPLFVAGNEVHQLFANANPNLNIETTTMINTNSPIGISGLEPVSFEIDHIVAPWEIDVAVKIENNVVPLKAEVGSPASKIAVDPVFNWCDERDDIREIYPNFSTYVQDTNVNWY